jgi:predicted ABC-type ATPase
MRVAITQQFSAFVALKAKTLNVVVFHYTFEKSINQFKNLDFKGFEKQVAFHFSDGWLNLLLLLKMKPVFYLIAGANGSGKTTLAHELLHEEKLVFLNADEIAARIQDDVGLAAGKILLKELDDVLAAKKSFAIESTISGSHHLRVLEKTKNAGYETVFVYVFLDNVELNVTRIRKRVLLGGHNVPEADVRRRYERSMTNFRNVKKLINRWELYYNGGMSYNLVARGNGGEEVLDSQLYEKFKRMQNV